MKPTFEIHFSPKVPDRAGLWIARRDNFISVMEIQESDIIRAAKDPTWLDGEWGAQLVQVPRDVVPLTRKAVQEYLDKSIVAWNDRRNQAIAETVKLKFYQSHPEAQAKLEEQTILAASANQRVECLQLVRQSLLGDFLVLPDHDDSQETPER